MSYTVASSFTQQHDAWWWFKLNGLMRHTIAKGLTVGLSHPIIMTEYPKSGGTWLSQMLSHSTGIPYPRNQLPNLRGGLILHGCYFRTGSKKRTIVLWRDGRDIMVSFYYHYMYSKPITSKAFSTHLKKQINITDPADITNNLPRFIEWCYEGGYPGFTWNEFTEKWYQHPAELQTSYEKLLNNPAAELEKLLGAVAGIEVDKHRVNAAVEEYRFEKQANRNRGEEDVTSFVRKGISGDWKNQFNQQAREVFAHYSGQTLIELGYEKDLSWV